MSNAQAEQPEWLAAWQNDTNAGLSQKIGNPNWHRGMKSPNPSGRPPGQSKQTKLMQRMLDDAGQVVDAVIGKAKEGDTAAAGLVLSRILPALRSQSEKVAFEFDPSLPVSKQVEQVLLAVSEGALAPDIGKQIIEAIGALSAVRLAEEVEARLAALEDSRAA